MSHVDANGPGRRPAAPGRSAASVLPTPSEAGSIYGGGQETPWPQDHTVEIDVAPAGGARRWAALRRPWVLPVAGVLVAVALVAALLAGAFDSVPLLNASVSAAVETLAVTALIRSWFHPERRWVRRALPLLLVSVAVVCGGVAFLLRVTNTITDSYPLTFGLWIGMALAALVGLPLTVRRGQPARRIAAVAAVPLTLTGALMLIDQEYGVWPQVGDMFGRISTTGTTALNDDVTLNAPTTSSTQAAPHAGELVALDVPSTTSHFKHRRANVYLPPAYFTPLRSQLPVLLMLAGSLGTPDHWPRAGKAVATVNKYAAAHHGIAPVMVFADVNGSSTADTECVDGPQGKAETYLTTDVRDFTVNKLHMPATPEKWGVVGFSEGGTCALTLTLRHPDIYRHIISLGGDDRPTFGDDAHTLSALFGGSSALQLAHDPVHLMSTKKFTGMTAWFTAGTDDQSHLTTAKKLTTDAARAGIKAHQFTGVSGHNWQFASAAFAHVLPQLMPELGAPAG